jgi:pimeloyl-ACP methyl ester carboxylesterase
VTRPRRVAYDVPPGLALAGDSWGDPAAPSVLLLHGGGQTRHAWGGTARVLAERGFHAIALDLRGHGESAWPPDADYRIDAFAGDVRAVAAHFASPPALVGASLGGLASLIAAGEAEQPIASALVLVDIAPRLRPEGVERIVAFMTGHPDGFATLHDAAEAVAAYMPHRPRPKDTAGLEKNLRRGADGRWRWHWDPRFIGGKRSVDATRDPVRLDAAASRLRIPTLLVRGRMSDVVAEEDARHFLALMPGGRYVDVSGAGHMVAGDRNDRFTEAVVGFLSEPNLHRRVID